MISFDLVKRCAKIDYQSLQEALKIQEIILLIDRQYY